MTSSPSRLAYGLLFAMTVMTFGGPLVLTFVMGGGQQPRWPPDRPVEWAALGVVVGVTSLLLLLCLSIRWWLPDVRPGGDGPNPRRAGGVSPLSTVREEDRGLTPPARQDFESRALSE